MNLAGILKVATAAITLVAALQENAKDVKKTYDEAKGGKKTEEEKKS